MSKDRRKTVQSAQPHQNRRSAVQPKSDDPEVVELTKQKAVELIATLAAQLAGVALPMQMTGATTSANLMSGKRVVIYYRAPPPMAMCVDEDIYED